MLGCQEEVTMQVVEPVQMLQIHLKVCSILPIPMCGGPARLKVIDVCRQAQLFERSGHAHGPALEVGIKIHYVGFGLALVIAMLKAPSIQVYCWAVWFGDA